MTEQAQNELKGQVKEAIKEQKKLDALKEQIDTLSEALIARLRWIRVRVDATPDPLLVRFGKKIFQVFASPTVNPVEPVFIREATLVV